MRHFCTNDLRERKIKKKQRNWIDYNIMHASVGYGRVRALLPYLHFSRAIVNQYVRIIIYTI